MSSDLEQCSFWAVWKFLFFMIAMNCVVLPRWFSVRFITCSSVCWVDFSQQTQRVFGTTLEHLLAFARFEYKRVFSGTEGFRARIDFWLDSFAGYHHASQKYYLFVCVVITDWLWWALREFPLNSRANSRWSPVCGNSKPWFGAPRSCYDQSSVHLCFETTWELTLNKLYDTLTPSNYSQE